MSRISVLLLVGLLASITIANSQNTLEIRNNNLRVFLKSNGALLPDNGIHGFDYEQDGTFVPLIHFTGLWLGAVDVNGNLSVFQTQQGGRPGPLNATPGFDKAWQVTAGQIAAHRQDFADNGAIDNPVPEVFAWPGQGNPFFLEYNSFELPANQGFGLAPFWDENGDGLYNPENGDFPMLAVRGCGRPIIPTQMNWTIFTLEGNFGHPLEVSLNVFYFDCEEMNPLRETIFTHYQVVDRADFAPPLPEARWGLFTDADLGCPLDDYVGTFPERNAAYFYNADNEDEDCLSISGFGANPPALGIDLYRGPLGAMAQPTPLATAIPFFNPNFGSFPPGATDPNILPEYFNYLQGQWRDGSPLTEGGIGYGGSEPASFAFPGLPQQGGGWTEWEAGNGSGDRRVLMSYEPFELFPGAVNEVIAGYTVYRGGEDHLAQAEGLRDQLDVLQAYFDFCLEVDLEDSGLPPCTQVLTGVSEADPIPVEVSVAPNPASGRVWVTAEAAIASIVLFDARGRSVFTGAEARLNVSGLPAGLYFLHVRTTAGTAVRKLLVK